MSIDNASFANHPELWRQHLPVPGVGSHKYTRGHTIVFGGSEMTGAARLTATAALRVGCGLVTLLSPPDVFPIYAAALTSVMVRRCDPASAGNWLVDDRITACIAGPGLGAGEATRQLVLAILASGKPAVLDADALTSFADQPQTLFDALHGNVILTPHGGEFQRLFTAQGDKVAATCDAARQSGAIVLHKGAETVIAAPDGRAVTNTHASPYLATAGSGDVLAGLCGGLLGQGMPAFDAACAAAWLHGDAALRLGCGLIAEDLPGVMPVVLGELLGERKI